MVHVCDTIYPGVINSWVAEFQDKISLNLTERLYRMENFVTSIRAHVARSSTSTVNMVDPAYNLTHANSTIRQRLTRALCSY